MATRREENLAALQNPQVRTMLDLIAAAEGVKHGYNTAFGNKPIGSLADHPRQKHSFKQTDGKRNVTTAAGRYQFLQGTWDDVAKANGSADFSALEQDLGAVELLRQNGALPAVQKGDFATALKKSGATWASLPSSPYAQPKRSQEFVNTFLAKSGTAPVAGATAVAATTRATPGTPAMAQAVEATAPVVAAVGDLLSRELTNLDAPPATPMQELAAMQQAALAAQQPDTGEAMPAWEQQLMSSALDMETDAIRDNAVSSFFGEDPVARVPLPAAIEEAINRFVANI